MKDLIYSKDQIERLYATTESTYGKEIPIERILGNAQQAADLLGATYRTALCLCKDHKVLEAEVERLREENETLKKQMEDDLK